MSLTKDFDNALWYETVDGDGTVVTGDSGASIVCSSGIGSKAYKRYYVSARAGEKFTVRVWARNKPEAGRTGHAALFVDAPIGTLLDTVKIVSDEPRVYTLHFEVPQQFDKPTNMAIGLGAYGSLDGSAEFWSPELYREGSKVVMQGTLKFPSGGGVEVVPDFLNNGIGNTSWRASEIGWRIEPSEFFGFSETGITNQFKPLVTLTGGLEGNDIEPYVWYCSQVNNVGWCTIQAVSLTTGAPVNLNTGTNQDRFVSFKMEMVG